ncbi:MAG TPA: DUF3341 domain-containing protein [Lichenihabitans sp.]|jgi:hypothetical protein|nr:DUF3341 domain-containing protein [Lichenihabitans sp.]
MASERGHAANAPFHAIAAQFGDAEALLDGVRALRIRKLGRLDAYSPVPVPGMSEALGLGRSAMTSIALAAAIFGFAGAMALCIYATAYDYVFDIGGRPRVSWPAFVVPSFSFAMLCGALVVYLVMLFLNRLPRLNHPAFNIPEFERVTRDRYFLTVEAGDQPIEPDKVEAALAALAVRPLAVSRVQR